MPWGKVPTVWGIFYGGWEGPEILGLRFPGDPPNPPLLESPLLWQLAAELDEYFRGERARFTVPMKLVGPPFYRLVWEELLCIPYGETLTYGDLAKRLGRPRAARAVGLALARNPLPIIVPCHRVVGKNGLGGFGPGRAWKEKLLSLEASYREKFSPR
ncbi:MAG: methylated-DNA--[protein]-cysteine S-methyltransferase [Candidatus Bipolaricaulaceae bacterium]